jgi:hypothetical protein
MSAVDFEIPKIVFVHLGKAKAPHLWLNLQRTQTLFPSASIHLIIEERTSVPKYIREFVVIHIYVRTIEISKLREQHMLASGFRNGFWWFSLERLIALGQAHNAIGNSGIIHLESDVMLMPNFPFHFFELEKLSWCRYNEIRDVASILYSPDIQKTEWLITQIINSYVLNPTHTDMTILSEISNSHADKVCVLPYLGNHEVDLRNKKFNLKSAGLEISNSDHDPQGIFDAAPLGMWLCGQDPRNHYGFTRFEMRNIIESGDSYIDPSKFEFSYRTDSGLRISAGSDALSIWNLHIHSKNLKLLSNNWEAELQRILACRGQRSEFSVRIFCSLVISNLKQRTLLRYFAGAPPIYRVIKPLRDRIFQK